jgi:hypothetical protein
MQFFENALAYFAMDNALNAYETDNRWKEFILMEEK